MKPTKAFLVLLIAAVAWLGGYGYGHWYGPRQHAADGARSATKPRGYHCPMHPNFRSDKPGECGICGMRLVPDDEPEEARGPAPESPLPAGTIRVSLEKQQLIGVRFGTAEFTEGTRTFRTVGTVAPDETRVAKVQTKIEGWIDKVYVDFTGKPVREGDALLTLYSPEMLATQEEYLLALRGRGILRGSRLAGAFQQSDSLVAAARKRLELWDLSEDQINEIERTGKALRNITLHSPISGYVMQRNAFPKQRITPETELYTVVDLSRVWIMADVFESDATRIREGMPVQVRLPYEGGKVLAARVDYIQPQIEPMTRTLKVRLEANNPGLALKPDMFVDVDFRIATPRRLTVPAEAVLDSGLRKTVFVDRGNGYLERRPVETGERMDGRIEIVRGLDAGERVVTSGNFLIDSESQFKMAASGMAGHQHD